MLDDNPSENFKQRLAANVSPSHPRSTPGCGCYDRMVAILARSAVVSVISYNIFNPKALALLPWYLKRSVGAQRIFLVAINVREKNAVEWLLEKKPVPFSLLTNDVLRHIANLILHPWSCVHVKKKDVLNMIRESGLTNLDYMELDERSVEEVVAFVSNLVSMSTDIDGRRKEKKCILQ